MRIVLAAAAAWLVAAPAQAGREPFHWPELGVEASIAFPSHGAIRNFEADGDDGIWLEDIRHRWYYGKFIGPCRGLPFVQAIGFDTRGSAQFDRFAKIVVDGQQCQLESLVTADKPLPRKEREKIRKAAEKAAKDAAKPLD